MQAMPAAAGKVVSQAMTMLPATFQRTAESRLVEPTPMIAEVIVWVVEIGAFSTRALKNSTELATVSAAKPSAGPRSMILRPRVRMIRPPPAYVPAASTVAEVQNTHHGISVALLWKPPV